MNELLDVVVEGANGSLVVNGREEETAFDLFAGDISPEQWAALRRIAIAAAKLFAAEWGRYFPVRVVLFDQYGGG